MAGSTGPVSGGCPRDRARLVHARRARPPRGLARLYGTAAHLQGAEPFPLESEAQEASARALLSTLATIVKEAEALRERDKRPHLQAGREIDALYKDGREPIKAFADALRVRVEARALARLREREAIVATVADASARGDLVTANAALASAPAERAPDSVSEGFTWEAVEIRLREVPDEYKILDMPKVRAEIAAAVREDRAPAVPGIRFERKARLIVRGVR